MEVLILIKYPLYAECHSNAGNGTRWENGAYSKKMKEFLPIDAYLVGEPEQHEGAQWCCWAVKEISQWGWRSLGKVGQDLAGLWRYHLNQEHSAPSHRHGMANICSLAPTNAWTFGWSSCGTARRRSCLSISSTDMAKPTFLLGSVDCHHHILVPVWIPAFQRDESGVADPSFRLHEGFL